MKPKPSARPNFFSCVCLVCMFVLAVWGVSFLFAVTGHNYELLGEAALYGIPASEVMSLYDVADVDQIGEPRVNDALVDELQNPCDDFALYSCGTWHGNMKEYSAANPESFSATQKKTVGLFAAVITNQSDADSPLYDFYRACTATSSNLIMWGMYSSVYVKLVEDIRSLPWSRDTLSSLLGRMAALGMDIPISVTPIRNPFDHDRGGWTLQVMQAGIIGGGAFDSQASKKHRFDPAPWNYYVQDLALLRSLYVEDVENFSDMERNRYADSTLTFMRDMSRVYLKETSRTCWKRTSNTDAFLWGDYFLNEKCYQTDNLPRTAFDEDEEASPPQFHAFNWRLFVEQIDKSAWSRVVNVWFPQGTEWMNTVLNVKFSNRDNWRRYLESSVRYSVYRHYFAAGERKVGILSPIVDVSPQWTAEGALSDRTRQWVPPLLYDVQGTAPLWQNGINVVRRLSNEFCVDMTFVHMQWLAELKLRDALGYGDTADFSSLIGELVLAMQDLVVHGGASWTQSTRAFFVDKLNKLQVVFSGAPADSELHTDIEEYARITSLESESFVHNVLAVRKAYIAKRWRMDAPAPLELPVFDMDAYYDQTTNSLIVSSSVFSWPLYAKRSSEGAPEMYGRFFGSVTRALAQVLTSRGRSTTPQGCILDPTYWISSTRVLDRASFTSNQHCIADQVAERTQIDARLARIADDMVANNIALRVAYHALTTDERIKDKGLTHQVIKRFFLSWAQTQCMKIGDVPSRYQLPVTVEDLHTYYITLPLRNLNEWRVLYQCDQVEPTCDFFM